MRNHNLDAKVGKAAAANGGRPVATKRRKRRRWSAEEKIRITRESFGSSESVTAVAARYGIARNRLSAWRSQLRQGKLVAPSSAKAPPQGAFAAVVQNELGLDPYSGVAYVFRAKRTDRIKVLWFDGTGLVLAYKRLEQGRFAWPAVRDGVIRLTRAQFEALFEGLDWRRAWSPRVPRPRAVA